MDGTNCNKVCSAYGCDRKQAAKQLCMMHYKRQWRHGTLEPKNERHGLRLAPEYCGWAHMWGRCTNHRNKNYKNYGGRGITVCDRWKSFTAFMDDMEPRPSLKHSIDRIDNEGNYEPGNCRWATATTQARNQRLKKSNRSGVKGVYFNTAVGKWHATITAGRKRHHLGHFDNIIDAAAERMRAEKIYHA